MCHCKFIVCDFLPCHCRFCLCLMYCLLCFWHSSHKQRKEEKENHSPSTVGKANDLSQPLLSPRLAARKLPAVLHTLVTDYIIFQKYQHVIRIEKKKRKKTKKKKPVWNPSHSHGSPASYPLHYGKASRA